MVIFRNWNTLGCTSIIYTVQYIKNEVPDAEVPRSAQFWNYFWQFAFYLDFECYRRYHSINHDRYFYYRENQDEEG